MWKKEGLVNRSEEVRLAFVLPVPIKVKSHENECRFFFSLRETCAHELSTCIYFVYTFFQSSTSSGLKNEGVITEV